MRGNFRQNSKSFNNGTPPAWWLDPPQLLNPPLWDPGNLLKNSGKMVPQRFVYEPLVNVLSCKSRQLKSGIAYF
jgi:hypothetical protein